MLIVAGVALAIVWGVSGWFDVYRMWNVPGGAWLAGMRYGGIEVNFYGHGLKEGFLFERRAGVFRNAWFRYATMKNTLGTTERWMYAPLWPVALGSIAGGVGLLRWGLYAELRRRGRCAFCGYDLRGLGEGARCPECGEGAEMANSK